MAILSAPRFLVVDSHRPSVAVMLAEIGHAAKPGEVVVVADDEGHLEAVVEADDETVDREGRAMNGHIVDRFDPRCGAGPAGGASCRFRRPGSAS